MSVISTKLLSAAAGSAGGAGLDVAEVFSTYLYDGTGANQNIVNGIDLAGEGGLVWLKARNVGENNILTDSSRGVTKLLNSNDSLAEASNSDISAFNSNGFSLQYVYGTTNTPNTSYASWTWRKAKKYFDVVKYTGNGQANRSISHNLGSVPGMIISKGLGNAYNWQVYHRSLPIETGDFPYTMSLNTTGAQAGNQTFYASGITSTEFEINSYSANNQSGIEYVAYLFAHNDGDGEFGPDADQDIIKCGSYTGTGTAGNSVDLGFAPQWILLKNADASGSWAMYDTMRGWTVGGSGDARLFANSSGAESLGDAFHPTATGFEWDTGNATWNNSGNTFIYMSIRAPMITEPEAATEVFAVAPRSSTSGYDYAFVSNFPVDFGMSRTVLGATEMRLGSRLTGDNYLQTPNTQAETASSDWYQGDSMNSVGLGFSKRTENPNEKYAWMWKRAKGYADAVCYTGTGSNTTQAHSLGVAPEMMWVKCRSSSESWAVYHAGITNPAQNYLYLNESSALNPNGNTIKYWNNTNPTDSVFTVGIEDRVNGSAKTYIAYLFATLDGISKVGSYTGTGADLVVNCGFTSGARFVLIKRTDGTGPWLLFDVLRGITTASTDGIIKLNVTDASETEAYYGGANMIEPSSYGFKLTSDGELNTNGQTYIFYAIA